MHRLLLLCVATLVTTGCYDSSFGEPAREEPREVVTTTINKLHEVFAGTTFRIDSDVVLTGRVTTSDRNGNFYRTFCIEEQGAAIEVMAGIDYLHNDYPVGCRVTLHLRGCALGMNLGVLQVGRMPAFGSGFATDYIGSRAALDIVVRRNTEQATITPSIQSFTTLNTSLCGTLIRVEGLRYTPEEELQTATWAGYRLFTDDQGNKIYTYVRNYADFATAGIPTERVALTGILQYDPSKEGRYIIKLRDEADCTI